MRGRSFWFWLSVGWRLSGWRLERHEVDHRTGRSFDHRRWNIWRWRWNICKWSGARAWRWNIWKIVKRLCVVPHVSQTIRNASWHGAAFPVRRHQLLASRACQHHAGASAKAHLPHTTSFKPAQKADVGVTRCQPLAGCLLITFPFATGTCAPSKPVLFAPLAHMGTHFAVAATHRKSGRHFCFHL